MSSGTRMGTGTMRIWTRPELWRRPLGTPVEIEDRVARLVCWAACSFSLSRGPDRGQRFPRPLTRPGHQSFTPHPHAQPISTPNPNPTAPPVTYQCPPGALAGAGA